MLALSSNLNCFYGIKVDSSSDTEGKVYSLKYVQGPDFLGNGQIYRFIILNNCNGVTSGYTNLGFLCVQVKHFEEKFVTLFNSHSCSQPTFLGGISNNLNVFSSVKN